MHLNAVGGDCPGKTELHGDILRRPRCARRRRVRAAVAHRRRDPAAASRHSRVIEFADVLTRPGAGAHRRQRRDDLRFGRLRARGLLGAALPASPASGSSAARSARSTCVPDAGRSEGSVRRAGGPARSARAAQGRARMSDESRRRSDRRAHRHRRERSRRIDGPGSAARRGPAASAAQPRPARSSTAAISTARRIPGSRRSTAIGTSREVVDWNRLVHEAIHAELGARATADPARRRSLPGDRLDQRRRASLPRHAARSCACSGSTRTPISTPASSRRAATFTACRSRACAASARAS